MSRKDWPELPRAQIERAIVGQRKDLDALIRHYGPVVRWAVAARVRAVPRLPVEMEDLVGGVWLELCRNDFKRLRYYDAERGEFGYFIRMQAGQIAWNLIGREIRRPALAPVSDADLVDEPLESRVFSRRFLERFARLAKERMSESDWALFNAEYVEGLASEEIAERLGKKVKTVYQQKYRLQSKLEAVARELLGEASSESGARPSAALVQLVVAASILALMQ